MNPEEIRAIALQHAMTMGVPRGAPYDDGQTTADAILDTARKFEAFLVGKSMPPPTLKEAA